MSIIRDSTFGDIAVIRSVRKTITAGFEPDGTLQVRAPRQISDAQIRTFLQEHRSRLLRIYQETKAHYAQAQALKPYTRAELKELAERACREIPPRVSHFAELLGVTYGRITIRNQKTRWGSCTANGNLNFNCLLMDMPPEILDSVVAHELTHRIHLDHSRAFYAELRRIFPQYDECSAWLKEHGPVYLMRMMNASD